MSLINAGTGGMAWRFLRSRPLRALLTTLGVALGVALIAAITILGAGLKASIVEQLRQGFGTYDVMAGYHDRLMQPEEQQKLSSLPGVTYSVGVLYLSPGRPETKGVDMKYNYIGMGVFPKGQYAYPLKEGRYPGPAEFVTEQRMADQLGLKLGDTITLPFKGGDRSVRLAGVMKNATESSNSLMFNLTWLQQEMGLGSQTTLMLFGLGSDTFKDSVGADMRKALPEADIELRRELDEVEENLGGLMPMAVIFGIAGLFASVFLVAGSFGIAVQERSRELALLRAVGAGQKQVMNLVLREAALLGALGGLAGVGIGGLIAWGAMGTATESLGVNQTALVLPWAWLAVEAAAGALLAVVAAWRPAWEAGRVPPLQAMRPDAARARDEKVGGRAGLVLLGIGALMALGALPLEAGTGGRALLGAAGGLLFVAGLIMAQARMLPWVVGLFARPLARLFPPEALMAGRSVLRHRKRSAMTTATLILGIMLVTSLGTIFWHMWANQGTWLRSQFHADAMIETDRDDHLGMELPARLAAIPGVTGVFATGDGTDGMLTNFDFSKADPVWMAEMGDTKSYDGYRREQLDAIPIDFAAAAAVYDFGRVRGSLTAEPGIVLSERQARERGIAVGETVNLRFHEGFDRGRLLMSQPKPFKVIAVVENLPARFYEALVTRSLFPEAQDQKVMFNYDQSRQKEVLAAVREVLQGREYGTANLRDLSDALADERAASNQRLVIFGAVCLVIFLIGFFGLFNSMMTGLHQRQREMATLRAVGSAPAQVVRQVLLEAVLVGAAGSVLGILAGLAFTGAAVAGLGDELEMWRGIPLFAASLVVGPALAALAGITPALRVSRGQLSRLMQAE
ncbi:MAG TPA: FtsX-like permease family protein [Symbiobacteriaceae bacterium]|nr:FtsX-like permease family protein [Symbiobacteriaceae bacterium]